MEGEEEKKHISLTAMKKKKNKWWLEIATTAERLMTPP